MTDRNDRVDTLARLSYLAERATKLADASIESGAPVQVVYWTHHAARDAYQKVITHVGTASVDVHTVEQHARYDGMVKGLAEHLIEQSSPRPAPPDGDSARVFEILKDVNELGWRVLVADSEPHELLGLILKAAYRGAIAWEKEGK